MNKTVRAYLSKIGSKGGRQSKRVLTPEQAREMVKAKSKKKNLEHARKSRWPKKKNTKPIPIPQPSKEELRRRRQARDFYNESLSTP